MSIRATAHCSSDRSWITQVEPCKKNKKSKKKTNKKKKQKKKNNNNKYKVALKMARNKLSILHC